MDISERLLARMIIGGLEAALVIADTALKEGGYELCDNSSSDTRE